MKTIDIFSDLILLNIGYTELNADWNWNKISSPFARLYYVKGGKAQININKKKYLLKPENLYLIPPFTVHDDESDSFFALYYIHFYEYSVGHEPVFDNFDFPIEVSAQNIDLLLVERLLQINPDRHLKYIDPRVYDNPPTFSLYMAENKKISFCYKAETNGILWQLFSRFLAQANPKNNHPNDVLVKTLLYINENIEKKITVEELAGIVFVSKDHFTRIFKKAIGITPVKYINLKKIEKAQLLLIISNSSVQDIALELSIDNFSYFTRLFKQHTGVSPTDYRELHK